jgi:hypothetical protein
MPGTCLGSTQPRDHHELHAAVRVPLHGLLPSRRFRSLPQHPRPGGRSAPGTPHLSTVVSRNVPEVRLVRADTRTGFPWLEEPAALAALIADHLEAGAPVSKDAPHE